MEEMKALTIIAIFSFLMTAIGVGINFFSMVRGEQLKPLIQDLAERYPYMATEDLNQIMKVTSGFQKWRYIALGMLLSNIIPSFFAMRAIKRTWFG